MIDLKIPGLQKEKIKVRKTELESKYMYTFVLLLKWPEVKYLSNIQRLGQSTED